MSRLLGGIQRMTYLSIAEAVRTTPTAALEVLLRLPPLHIYIQREARLVTHRSMQRETPISQSHCGEYLKLYNELKADPIPGIPVDNTVSQYNFQKDFIPSRKDCQNGPPAEVAAIEHCIGEINRQKVPNGTVVILYNSQAAIEALSSFQVFSRLVGSCLSAVKELSTQNRVTLAWVPGHEGHKDNEKANVLAREGASKAMICPEPFCGLAKAYIKPSINSWMQAASIDWWNKLSRLRQANQFIKKSSPRFTA
ncbi:uncharacterized protein [Leptinotarsa decemlineata]|uniref:uncharacterized protein n=1 Tax=Leptinotarsa decemlineata TaxID=7539 RepID=UPI003D308B7B